MKHGVLPEWFRTRWREMTLAVLAAVFFASSCVLIVANRLEAPLSQAVFDWPDETMNFFFARRIADGEAIPAPDPLIAEARNRIHPRSFNVVNSALVPGGFLGMPVLAGTVGFITRAWGMLLITPAFAVGGVFALSSIARRIFGPQIGWLTCVLAFTNPALLYYTAFVMLPNAAFVSLILIAIALALAVGNGSRKPGADTFFSAISGLCLGFALFIRTNELWWTGPVFLTVLLARRRIMGNRNILAVAGAAAAVGIVMLVLNAAVYGSPYAIGYARFGESGAASVGASSLILPFGFHPRLMAFNVWNVFVRTLWWGSIPTALGFGIWLSYRRKPGRQILYAALLAATGLWLIVYYGSWGFDDPLTLRLNTIGISYVRYWLPLILGSIPFAALGIWSLGCVRGPRRIAAGVLVAVMAILSFRLAFFSERESIIPVARRIREYHRASLAVAAATPPDAVILTWRTDKIVFPARRVAAVDLALGLDAGMVGVIRGLDLIPWFLYARLTPEEEAAVSRDLAAASLAIDAMGEPRPGETLYRIRRKL